MKDNLIERVAMAQHEYVKGEADRRLAMVAAGQIKAGLNALKPGDTFNGLVVVPVKAAGEG